MALLICVLSVVAFISLLLALPLGIWLSVSFHGGAVFAARIKYFFGLFSWELSTGRRGIDREVTKEADGKSDYGISRVIEAARVKGVGDKAGLLAKNVARRVKVRSVQSDLEVSLGDDYYTGILAGLLIPLVLYLNQRFTGAISLRPVFEEDLFLEGDVSCDLLVRPIHVLAPCLAFALSPEFRKARRAMAGGQCKKR